MMPYQAGYAKGSSPAEVGVLQITCANCGKEHRFDPRLNGREDICYMGCGEKIIFDKNDPSCEWFKRPTMLVPDAATLPSSGEPS